MNPKDLCRAIRTSTLTEQISSLKDWLENNPDHEDRDDVEHTLQDKIEIYNNRMEISQKDAEIHNNRMEISQKDEVISQKDEVISQKDAEIYKNSIAEMLKTYGGIPDMPEVEPYKPHEDQKHKTCCSIDQTWITADDLDFEINEKDQRTGHLLKSFLVSQKLEKDAKNNKSILTYGNEATVANYVHSVVKMCLQSLGLFESCEIYQEMSYLSLRPDLILVRHKQKGIILIIEVKMPGDKMSSSAHIAAQVADYLMLQYRLGNHMPLVLLSSYREARLCHLKPGSFDHEDDESDGGDHPKGSQDIDTKFRKIVEEASASLKNKTYSSLLENIDKVQEDSKKKEQYSPSKPGFAEYNKILVALQQQNDTKRQKRETNLPTLKIVQPEVVYSTAFTTTNMMQGIILSIICGLLIPYEKNAEIHGEAWPEQSRNIDGLHLCVNPTKFEWAHVTGMSINYMQAPKESCEKYIILQDIGAGKNGRVFLAVDRYGNACALKIYLASTDPETQYSSDQRKAERKKHSEDVKNTIFQEVEHWNNLQSEYKNYVQWLQLNGQNALRMPVFAPVPQDSREEVLSGIKDLLENLQQKGYFYNEVRWQHIGCRRNGEGLQLALLDLESLRKSSEESAPTVKDQIESLEKRMRSEAVGSNTGLFLT